MSLRILLDENAMAHSTVTALKGAGHDVETAADAGLRGQHDAIVLAYANQNKRVVLTYNCDDFAQLHDLGQPHQGILLSYPEKGAQLSNTYLVGAIKESMICLGTDLVQQVVVLNHWAYNVRQ